MPYYPRTCAHCQDTFVARRTTTIYCAPACGDAARTRARTTARAATAPDARICARCASPYAPKAAHQRYCGYVCARAVDDDNKRARDAKRTWTTTARQAARVVRPLTAFTHNPDLLAECQAMLAAAMEREATARGGMRNTRRDGTQRQTKYIPKETAA